MTRLTNSLAKNELLPDTMFGTSHKVVIQYDKSNDESADFNRLFNDTLQRADAIWQNVSLEIKNVDDNTTQYIIREVK